MPVGDVPGLGARANGRRREREKEIIAATRSLFDLKGVREAQIDQIADAVDDSEKTGRGGKTLLRIA